MTINTKFASAFYCQKIGGYNILIIMGSFVCRVAASSNKDPDLLYRIGLCYFLVHSEEYKEYWGDAQRLNPGVFKGRIYLIPSDWMAPTPISGDHIIIEPDYYEHKKVQIGDVIAFLNPKKPGGAHISRVIGLPNDQIEIKDKNVIINKKVFGDIFGNHNDSRIFDKNTSTRDNFGPVTIQAGHYFVLGDNRDNSLDSRFFGSENKEYILGRALIIYFSAPDRYSFEGARPERIGLSIK